MWLTRAMPHRFGFISYKSHEDALHAMQTLHQKELKDHPNFKVLECCIPTTWAGSDRQAHQAVLTSRPDAFQRHVQTVLCLQVRLAPSQSKNKLYVGNVPKLWSPEKWEAELKKVVKGEQPLHADPRKPALPPP